MGQIKLISQTGIFKGLQDKKSDLINLRMSEINNPNKKIRVISNSGAKVARLLLDIEPNNFEGLINYLNEIYQRNPNIEFHINVEVDKYFELAKRIMGRVPFVTKSITLYPDGELKDRTYLDLKHLNCLTIVPLQYAMWHDDIEHSDSSRLFFNRADVDGHDGTLPLSLDFQFVYGGVVYAVSAAALFSLEDALSLKKEVLKVLRNDFLFNYNFLDDDQKVLIMMKYVVDNLEYSSEPIDAFAAFIQPEFAHRGDTTLKYKRGVCQGIAEVFMMLLNNPIMRIDCRVLHGLDDKYDFDSGHAWVVLKLSREQVRNNSWFYFDPSHNVCTKDCYSYNFLKSSSDVIAIRKIFECENPEYITYNGPLITREVQEARLANAMLRIDKAKRGIAQIRVIRTLEENISELSSVDDFSTIHR